MVKKSFINPVLLMMIACTTLVSALVAAPSAYAAYSSSNLIDNYVFRNKSAMSSTEIQRFLESKGGKLADLSWNGKKASQIVYDASQDWGINPRVILATLQKEQSLITDPDPSDIQIRSAMGYGCPDDESCNSNYKGFSYQVQNGTWQLRLNYERANGNKQWYNPNIGYACNQSTHFYSKPLLPANKVTFYSRPGYADKTITIKNAATASLYCYTPHVGPYSQTGYSGSYNFVISFENWFGSTHSNIVFKDMKTPRWMQLSKSTRKVDPFTKEPLDATLPAGQQIFFTDSIKVGGATYLRTSHDKKSLLYKAIPLSLLDEVEVNYVSLKSPRWMELTEDMSKIDPLTRQLKGDSLRAGTKLYFSTLTEINEILYLRTEADTQNNQRVGIPYSDLLTNTNLSYSSLKMPRWFIANRDTREYDLKYPSGSSSSLVPKGSKLYLDHSVHLNGHLYATLAVPGDNEYPGINLDYLNNVSPTDFSAMKHQRAYRLLETTQKIDLATNKPDQNSITVNTPVYFQTLINLGDTIYLRTAHDGVNSRVTAIPVDKVSPIEVIFENMEEPRRLRVMTATKKVDPVTLQRLDETIPEDHTVSFSQKLRIEGKLYLRTQYDNNHGHFKVIAFSDLVEL